MEEGHRNRYGTLLAATLLFSVPVMSQSSRAPIDVNALGPQVGESVPDFSLRDQNGEAQTLESIMGPRGALILFHRSADW